MGAARSYDYVWRGDTPLAVGDWVDLPGNVVSPEGCIGRVESLKPPSYAGELKAVTAKLDDPWETLFVRVRDEKEASDAWQRARKAGLTTDRLTYLTELAKVALAKRKQATGRAGAQLIQEAVENRLERRKPFAQDGSTAHRATLTETPQQRLERRMRETDPEGWLDMQRDLHDEAFRRAAEVTSADVARERREGGMGS